MRISWAIGAAIGGTVRAPRSAMQLDRESLILQALLMIGVAACVSPGASPRSTPGAAQPAGPAATGDDGTIASDDQPQATAESRPPPAAERAPAPFATLDEFGRAYVAAEVAADGQALSAMFPSAEVLARAYTDCTLDVWALASERRRLAMLRPWKVRVEFDHVEEMGPPAVTGRGHFVGLCRFQEEATDQTVRLHIRRNGEADHLTVGALRLADGWWLIKR